MPPTELLARKTTYVAASGFATTTYHILKKNLTTIVPAPIPMTGTGRYARVQSGLKLA